MVDISIAINTIGLYIDASWLESGQTRDCIEQFVIRWFVNFTCWILFHIRQTHSLRFFQHWHVAVRLHGKRSGTYLTVTCLTWPSHVKHPSRIFTNTTGHKCRWHFWKLRERENVAMNIDRPLFKAKRRLIEYTCSDIHQSYLTITNKKTS